MFVAPPELLRVKKTAEPILADVSADIFMLGELLQFLGEVGRSVDVTVH